MMDAPNKADGQEVLIRRASIRDVPRIVAIWREGQISQGLEPIDANLASDIFTKRIESQTGAYGIWVAEIGEVVFGWQSLHQGRANPAQKWAESSTYIAVEAVGRGIGRKLLMFATEHAKSSRLSYVEGFIRAENRAPIRIVESLGWYKVGTVPKGPDDIEWLYYVYPVPRSQANQEAGTTLCSDAEIVEPAFSQVETLTREERPSEL